MVSRSRHPVTQTEEPLSDQDLVRGIRLGEDEAVEAFIERMGIVPQYLSVRNGRLGSPLSEDEVADLVQDVLEVVWRKLGSFAGRSCLQTWVLGICSWQLSSAVRKKRRRHRRIEDPRRHAHRDIRERPMLEDDCVAGGLERLELRQADVIRLRHFGALTFDEIAALQSIPVNTAKSLYYRGLSRLRELLEPHFREEYV
jgi:RNA polymerase sigma-70 factor (ECF subfamily)